MKISNKYILFIVFTFILVTSLNSCYTVIQASTSYNWKTTTGTVETSHVILSSDSNLPDELLFKYNYSVNSKDYSSNTVEIPASLLVVLIERNTYVNANSFSSQHPVGSSITVYYNPRNPSEAVVKPGFDMAQLMDLGYVCIAFFSFIVALFTYKKNPFFPAFTGTFSRIILTQFLNIGIFGIFSLFFTAFMLCNTLLFIFMLVFAYLSLFSYSIGIKWLLQVLVLPNVFFDSALYVLLAITIILFFVFIRKGIYSLVVKYNQNYTYFTTDYTVEKDIDTEKWLIMVSGYYVTKGTEIDFSYIADKTFQSKSQAEKFYQKHIQQDFESKETKRSFYLNKKTLYILTNKSENKEVQIKLSYSFYGYFMLFLSLSFFLAYDFMIFVLFGIKSASLSYLVSNIFNRINFSQTHQYVFSDNGLIDIISVLGIFELLFAILTVITGCYIFYKKVYKIYVLDKQDTYYE